MISVMVRDRAKSGLKEKNLMIPIMITVRK